ncbi:hypothetical protein EI171_23660 [Bradyrhizobium sp. LCT2]|uniref:hypothetical protein n=1 Tax=Bradyrhizobium sp. LCT2 TaxID=2493093 RepID=UPI0013746770|nr:hypothetical protein [Bradyrhizobium sp. LCT2]QHP70027.1 hypothetical protein EI171_23660 [Bradyrhizobium sp. LCT2]
MPEQEVLDLATAVTLGPDDTPPPPRGDPASGRGLDPEPIATPSRADGVPHDVPPEIKEAMLAAAYGRQLVDRLAALQNEEVTKHTGISRDELGLRVWNAPMGEVANRLGIKKHVLKRVCTLFEVPMPPRGYFRTSFVERQIRWTRVIERDQRR